MKASEFLKSKNWFAEEEEMEFMESALEEYAELKSIEFADYLLREDYEMVTNEAHENYGKWYKSDGTPDYFTTSELYQQFKNKL